MASPDIKALFHRREPKPGSRRDPIQVGNLYDITDPGVKTAIDKAWSPFRFRSVHVANHATRYLISIGYDGDVVVKPSIKAEPYRSTARRASELLTAASRESTRRVSR